VARPVLLVVGAGLFAGLVLAYAAFSWVETESRVLGAAEDEGRAVLDSVAAGIRSSLDASAAVESVLAKRLFDVGADLDAELADEPGALDEPLARFVKAHGLRGAVVLDATLGVRAAATSAPALHVGGGGDAPIDAARVARAEAERLAATARAAGLASRDRATFGFGESPFSTRDEYLVGLRASRLGGFLLLRQDAAPLRDFREQAGVAKLLKEAASGPGVAYLVVQDKDGRVLAADDASRVGGTMSAASSAPTWRHDTDGRRVLDVALPVRDETLRVGLAAGPVEEQIARGRRDVVVFSAISLAAGAALLAILLRRARRDADLAERERFASLGRLAAGVAHEVRSPLNAVSMAAQRLQREAAPTSEPERQRFLELTAALRAGVARLDGTVREFLALGDGGPAPQRAAVDVASVVDEVLAAENAPARRDPPATPVVARADRALFAKALANLVRNAHQIAPGTTRVAWRRDGTTAIIEVTDGGPGVPVADRERVFEPFFTRRPGGTGLGLAIARDAVQRQGGKITIGDAPGGGARFVIELPAEGQ